jgi:hypothetical protein
MVYNDTTNKTGVIQAEERYCGLGDAGISGDATRLKDFTYFNNLVMRKVWHAIFLSAGAWQYDDNNNTDLPTATTSLVTDQAAYSIPATALAIKAIEYKNTGGVWQKLIPLTENAIQDYGSMSEFHKTPGTPMYYTLVGGTIRLFPAANFSQDASLRVFFERGASEFVYGDTTKEPGFASQYHDIIPIGASLEYLKWKMPESAAVQFLSADYVKIENSIKDFYRQRHADLYPTRIHIADITTDFI